MNQNNTRISEEEWNLIFGFDNDGFKQTQEENLTNILKGEPCKIIKNKNITTQEIENNDSNKNEKENSKEPIFNCKSFKILTTQQKDIIDREIVSSNLKLNKKQIRLIAKKYNIPINRALTYVFNKKLPNRRNYKNYLYMNYINIEELVSDMKEIEAKIKKLRE
ncbi:hypothetical protein A0H76_2785 [Hepatospora eriocheir]|uniref:Uncharacterized protein n=1 Tax=Hepatospora eriocheir TaxID=1081669 RepID=A0A1X0QF53_9MICR|nr:hypothetical protein A0H76_2785 [Hepatospora eriocheir]